jgi:hypothetical protein
MVSFNKRCMICEQYVCNHWTEMCAKREERLPKERAKEGLAGLTPRPYLRKSFLEGLTERLVRTVQRPALQHLITCLQPNSTISNLSAQLASPHTP